MSLWRNGTGQRRPAGHSSRNALRNRLRTRSRALLKCACEPLEIRRLFATVSWITQGDGLWTNGANWNTGSPPTANDDVRIDIPGRNITVNYNGGGTLQLHNLLNNELLIIGGGGATWTSGTWNGAGVVQMSAPLDISGAADKIIKDGLTISNFSTVTLSGTGNIV